MQAQNNKQSVVKLKVDTTNIPLHRNAFKKKRQLNSQFELFKSFIIANSVPTGRTVRGCKYFLTAFIRRIRNPDKLKGDPSADAVHNHEEKSKESHVTLFNKLLEEHN